MSYNNRVIDSAEGWTTGNEGYFLDFDLNRFGHLRGDSAISVKFNRKSNRLKSKRHDFSIRLQRFGKDSLQFDSGENMMYVFRKLDLNHQLKIDKKDIEKFLIRNDFDSIMEIDLTFSPEQYMIDRMRDKPLKRFDLLVNVNESTGYWHISEIKSNFFLVLTLGQFQEPNIFQIESVSNCSIGLKPLQNIAFPKSIKELKTCL